MSLSDKIINGIMGTNIQTIKVSVEQLAQIVNETIIAATRNEEELRAIEKAIKGSHFFISGDLESSDGKFLFHISLYQRSLKHRTVWVKNLQTEEIFEWNGFSLGPFKRAMQPYLVNARMHPPISWYRDQIIQDAVNAMDGDPAEAYDSEEMSESIPNETAFYEPFNKPMPMPRRQNPAVIGVITVVLLIVIGVAASMYEENMKEKQAARQKELEQEYVVDCSGLVVLFPEPVNPKAEAIMKSAGMTLEGHVAKQFDSESLQPDTLILTVDESTKKKMISEYENTENVYTLSEFAGEGEEIPDPYGKPLTAYGECFEVLKRLIDQLEEKLNSFAKGEE